jgi:hypothetical protein
MNRRAGPRGGIAILVAFMLLALMAAAAFASSRNLVRELAVTGDGVPGARAASAAEAGLDWFLAWSSAAGGERDEGLQAFLAGLAEAPGGEGGHPPPLASGGSERLFSQPAGSLARQDFELRVRHLGAWPQPGMGRGGTAGGPADPSAIPPDQLWQVTATGRCRTAGGRVSRQVRELLVTAPCAVR